MGMDVYVRAPTKCQTSVLLLMLCSLQPPRDKPS
jgi:hypothetical protein